MAVRQYWAAVRVFRSGSDPRIAGTDIVCHFLPDDLCKDGDYPSRFVGMTRIKDRALWDGKRNPVLYDEESVKHMSNLQNYDVE